jgi:predicted amidohydrolase
MYYQLTILNPPQSRTTKVLYLSEKVNTAMKLKVSVGQMDIDLGNPERNLKKVRQIASEAAERESNLLVLPELWSTGYDLKNAEIHASPIGEGVFADIALLAKEYQLHIIGSNLSRLDDGGFGNTAVLYGPDGRSVEEYTKIHLFRLMEEDQYLTAGNHLSLADTIWGKVGLAICYDLRFPEMFRSYALSGAKMIILPAEWPYPRLNHWRTLLQARAIENQFFLIACNRVGTTKGIKFFGHSCIIDPWGNFVIEGGEEETVLSSTVHLDKIDEARTKIPIFQDRRPALYDQ